ncbi:MAG: right-handed parallel beta-helix repeat-containing protein [Chloroflexaceae bacterium]|nr:right-handed parallel beta-helix repeat-containing protein [Chloroflexaceae bacterium]
MQRCIAHLGLLIHRWWVSSLVVLVSSIALASVLVSPVAAATVVGDGSPASCTEAALRTALTTNGDITFNCGTVVHTITLSSALVIADGQDVRLDGAGLITLSGGDSVRLFLVQQGGSLALANLALIEGNATGDEGGAVRNSGSTTLTNVLVRNNTAGSGGGISNVNGGVLAVRQSTISDNIATSDGGGIFINSGSTTVISSTISDNVAENGSGGGLWYYQWNANLGGPLTVESSTLSGNTASDLGGAISTSGGEGTPELILRNCTLVDNRAPHSGAIFNGGTATTIANCTLAENQASDYVAGVFSSADSSLTMSQTILANDPQAPGGNCAHEGTFIDGGGNIQFPGTSCGAAVLTAEPLLAALADNGGPTQTMAPGIGSPAIDAGGSACLPNDQRGQPRPADGDGDGTAACDSGAYERQADETPPSADNVVGDGTPASCTPAALRAAVQRSGSITFNCGADPHTIAVTDEITITNDTTIDGGGSTRGGLITLSGQDNTRIMRTANNVTLTVRNMTFANGKEPEPDGSGSAIRTGWRATLIVENSVFVDNDSTAATRSAAAVRLPPIAKTRWWYATASFRTIAGAMAAPSTWCSAL